jgi:uncharacterized membrane protein YoaK (UPF0700 family)
MTARQSAVATRAGWLLPAVLSVTAGAVDVIGFLALGGLFTAHITGNVVILAAHYVIGGFSEVGPLLSVPVFIVVLGAVTLASEAIEKQAGHAPRRALLVLHVALLAGCLGLGVAFGPFVTRIAQWRCSSACSRSRRWPPRMRW